MRQVVAWDGPAPFPGDYLAGGRGDDIWRILSIGRVGNGRLSLDLHPMQPGSVPADAMVHGWRRMAPHDEAGPARVRQVIETGPTGVMRGAWRDPDDMRPNAAHKPREITGYRTYCPLRRMMAHKGSSIEPRHVLAADMLRGQVDIAVIGRGARQLDVLARQGFGPVAGPSGTALEQVWANVQAQRALARLAPSGRVLVTAVVLMNHPVNTWCRSLRPVMDQKLAVGRLLTCLDVLADHYAAEIDEATQRGHMLEVS